MKRIAKLLFNREKGTFIDEYLELKEQASNDLRKRLAAEQAWKQRLAKEEMDQLHEDDRQKRIAQAARQKTLNMAWLAGHELEASGVRRHEWMMDVPRYKLNRITGRQRQIGTHSAIQLEGWALSGYDSRFLVLSRLATRVASEDGVTGTQVDYKISAVRESRQKNGQLFNRQVYNLSGDPLGDSEPYWPSKLGSEEWASFPLRFDFYKRDSQARTYEAYNQAGVEGHLREAIAYLVASRELALEPNA